MIRINVKTKTRTFYRSYIRFLRRCFRSLHYYKFDLQLAKFTLRISHEYSCVEICEFVQLNKLIDYITKSLQCETINSAIINLEIILFAVIHL